MSSIDNRKILIRLIEQAGPTIDFDFIDKHVHPDVVLPDHLPGGKQGREGLKDGLRGYEKIFQGTVKVEDSFSEGEKVALRIVTRAKHIGEFLGIAATGQDFECDEIMIAHFDKGQVVRITRVADLYGLMQRLTAPQGVDATPGSNT